MTVAKFISKYCKYVYNFYINNIHCLFTKDNMQTVLLYLLLIYSYCCVIFHRIWIFIIKILMSLPDHWLFVQWNKSIKNTKGQYIQILNATTDHEVITNKLKLFLSNNWEMGGDDYIYDFNCFDFSKLQAFLECNILYCTYILTNHKYGLQPTEEFWSDVKKFIIRKKNDKLYKCKSQETEVDDEKEIFYVDFDN